MILPASTREPSPDQNLSQLYPKRSQPRGMGTVGTDPDLVQSSLVKPSGGGIRFRFTGSDWCEDRRELILLGEGGLTLLEKGCLRKTCPKCGPLYPDYYYRCYRPVLSREESIWKVIPVLLT
jgi:hypothetical protein